MCFAMQFLVRNFFNISVVVKPFLQLGYAEIGSSTRILQIIRQFTTGCFTYTHGNNILRVISAPLFSSLSALLSPPPKEYLRTCKNSDE